MNYSYKLLLLRNDSAHQKIEILHLVIYYYSKRFTVY